MGAWHPIRQVHNSPTTTYSTLQSMTDNDNKYLSTSAATSAIAHRHAHVHTRAAYAFMRRGSNSTPHGRKGLQHMHCLGTLQCLGTTQKPPSSMAHATLAPVGHPPSHHTRTKSSVVLSSCQLPNHRDDCVHVATPLGLTATNHGCCIHRFASLAASWSSLAAPSQRCEVMLTSTNTTPPNPQFFNCQSCMPAKAWDIAAKQN